MITVTVPATTANLGPGFDCIGAALTLYNQFEFRLLRDVVDGTEVKITTTGIDAEGVSTDKSNLVYQSFEKFYQQLGKTPPPIEIHINLGIPLARGLGSSATAIVGGLLAANYLAGKPLSLLEIRNLAIAIEGHPDNVVPALFGNCQLSVGEGDNWQISQIPWHQDIVPVLAIPDFEISTQKARSVVPLEISRADAIFNIARLGLLVRGLETHRLDWLQTAMEDKLHQPYRKVLIPGYEVVKTAAIEAGAYGMVISGAGPTLLALTNSTTAEAVSQSMIEAWKTEGVKAIGRSLPLDSQGATAKGLE
jgi:homoserine kinase